MMGMWPRLAARCRQVYPLAFCSFTSQPADTTFSCSIKNSPQSLCVWFRETQLLTCADQVFQQSNVWVRRVYHIIRGQVQRTVTVSALLFGITTCNLVETRSSVAHSVAPKNNPEIHAIELTLVGQQVSHQPEVATQTGTLKEEC